MSEIRPESNVMEAVQPEQVDAQLKPDVKTLAGPVDSVDLPKAGPKSPKTILDLKVDQINSLNLPSSVAIGDYSVSEVSSALDDLGVVGQLHEESLAEHVKGSKLKEIQKSVVELGFRLSQHETISKNYEAKTGLFKKYLVDGISGQAPEKVPSELRARLDGLHQELTDAISLAEKADSEAEETVKSMVSRAGVKIIGEQAAPEATRRKYDLGLASPESNEEGLEVDNSDGRYDEL